VRGGRGIAGEEEVGKGRHRGQRGAEKGRKEGKGRGGEVRWRTSKR